MINTPYRDDLNKIVVLNPKGGCGKTTLLSLITGDNPQAYANEIYLFGQRRGSGESIWDIKRQTGIISSELQIRYSKPITAFEVVLSGFFDSVGLYRDYTVEQKEIAEQWMEVFGIADKSDRVFNQLSYGEQRMQLLARAMVKIPPILILDEPTNDLDVETLSALEAALEDFPGCAVVISHDRFFLDRIATHILAFEGDSVVYWFEGNFSEYEENKKKRLGDATPHRIKFKKLQG